jgi:hypothetical protein
MDVIAIQRDIQLAERDAGAFELVNGVLQTLGERYAARTEPYEDQVIDAMVAFDDLMRQTRHGASDIVAAEQPLLARRVQRRPPSRPHGTALKGA